jgi:uncharacterized membrane protein YraQ (UPF0718 family)
MPAIVRTYGGWLFLALVAAAYALTWIAAPDIAATAVATLQRLLLRILPIIAVVFGLLVLANRFLNRRWVATLLSESAGLKGWLLSVLGGIASMGPMYAWYPLLRDLQAKGMSPGLIAAFLYSRALKLPLLPVMLHYFGLAYTITLSLCIILAAVLSGMLTGRLVRT